MLRFIAHIQKNLSAHMVSGVMATNAMVSVTMATAG